MRDVAAVRRWFTGLVLLGEQLSGADRDLLAERATWVTLPAGARLHAEGQPGSALWFLVQGEIVLGGAPGDAVDGVVRRAVTTPGYPVGWDGVVWPGRHRWDAVAASRTVLLRVGREVIEDHCRADEGFAARLHRLLLWLAGPGATHDYTLRIARLAETGRAVVHYDKLGCGRSTHLRDRGPDFWTVQLFLDELDNLLDHLGIRDRYAVLGQSWGGMLGAEHAIRRPAGLTSLVIADSPASMDLWVSEANRLRQALPAEVQETLLRHEAAGTTDSAEYREAELVFYARHVCRIVPNPPEVTASFAAIDEDPTVYHTMNGPSEFHVIGTLRHWSVVDQVGAIDVPTLVVTGAHDEATPATVAPFVDGIPGARWEVFADSSHMPHVEEEDRYLQVVGAYLDEHDTTSDRTLSDRTPSRDWSQTA